MNIGSILGSIFGNVTGGHYAQIAMALIVGGGIVKSLDANNTGVDDAAGDVAIAASKVFQALDSGDRNKRSLAITGLKAALDALQNADAGTSA